MRQVPEWVGKTDDSQIPARVRLRIFDRCGGICHLSQRKIGAGEPWQLDHVVALVNGGEHRESNLVPVLIDKHKEKTKLDVAEKSQTYYKRLKAIGIKTKKRAMGYRKFDGTIVRPKWK